MWISECKAYSDSDKYYNVHVVFRNKQDDTTHFYFTFRRKDKELVRVDIYFPNGDKKAFIHKASKYFWYYSLKSLIDEALKRLEKR